MKKKAVGGPEQIFEEYEAGRTFKSGLGRKGLYEQGKINERFYIGDQWHGRGAATTGPGAPQRHQAHWRL